MKQALQIAEINRLHLLKKITEGERLRRIAEIRAKYETKVQEITNKVC